MHDRWLACAQANPVLNSDFVDLLSPHEGYVQIADNRNVDGDQLLEGASLPVLDGWRLPGLRCWARDASGLDVLLDDQSKPAR